jgi:aspartate aminotransferase-like enzyme
VRRAFEQAPESHRAACFKSDFQATRTCCANWCRPRQVELLLGSGTLANDAVAGQLSLLGERGLVLSNGEFGDRLTDHARRFRLAFETLEFAWGEPFDLDAVRERLDQKPSPQWLWFAIAKPRRVF